MYFATVFFIFVARFRPVSEQTAPVDFKKKTVTRRPRTEERNSKA
jgi:hypothetical protein